MLTKKVAFELELPLESIAEAILANGELVELETYGCSIHWLGKVYDTQVVTYESEYGLIGTGLLVDRIITVDYRAKTVSAVGWAIHHESLSRGLRARAERSTSSTGST